MRGLITKRPQMLKEEAEKNRGTDAEKALKEKADDAAKVLELFLDWNAFSKFLDSVEDVLDKV